MADDAGFGTCVQCGGPGATGAIPGAWVHVDPVGCVSRLRTTLARLTAELAAVTSDRDMWRSECESISAELDLPPGMRPMEGELRRMLGHNRALLAERDEALNELATARAVAGRAAQAAQATGADLVHIGALCGMTDDEYPLKAVQRVVKERDEARGLLRDAMALVGQYENAVESASRMYHNTQEWGSDKEIEAMFQAVYDERGRIAAHLGRSE